jgi:glycosyltransferase involved in cell wall biosynthesis
LDVLLQAWEILQPQDCELHVFSSTKIYGKDFAISSEGNYQELYDKCESLPNVVYRSSVSNEQLRAELPTFDILAYPNTFEETSCISVIEALSAGLRVVTSALGALPETTEGWSRMYPYLMDKSKHAEVYAKVLGEEINKLKSGELDAHLELQKQVYAPRWSWNERIKEWTNFLDTLTQNEQSTLEPTSETLPNS